MPRRSTRESDSKSWKQSCPDPSPRPEGGCWGSTCRPASATPSSRKASRHGSRSLHRIGQRLTVTGHDLFRRSSQIVSLFSHDPRGGVEMTASDGIGAPFGRSSRLSAQGLALELHQRNLGWSWARTATPPARFLTLWAGEIVMTNSAFGAGKDRGPLQLTTRFEKSVNGMDPRSTSTGSCLPWRRPPPASRI